MTTPTPLLVRADEAETLADGPTSLITLLTDADRTDTDRTDGALTANRAMLRRGSPGAPPHYHRHMAESFYVLDGTLRMLAGEQILTLHKGDFIVIPKLMPHAFAPAGDDEAEVLVIFTPGLPRFDYYRLLQRVYRGEARADEIAATAQRFDNHYVDSPQWRRSA